MPPSVCGMVCQPAASQPRKSVQDLPSLNSSLEFAVLPAGMRIGGKLSNLHGNVENSRFLCQLEFMFKCQLMLHETA